MQYPHHPLQPAHNGLPAIQSAEVEFELSAVARSPRLAAAQKFAAARFRLHSDLPDSRPHREKNPRKRLSVRIVVRGEIHPRLRPSRALPNHHRASARRLRLKTRITSPTPLPNPR